MQGKMWYVVSSDYQLQKTIFRPNVIRRSSRQFVGDLQEHTKSDCKFSELHYNESQDRGQDRPQHGGQAEGAAG